MRLLPKGTPEYIDIQFTFDWQVFMDKSAAN